MSLELLAIDLGKRSFHLYGIDTDGVILSRKVSRAKLAEVISDLGPTAIAMEACASAHAHRPFRGLLGVHSCCGLHTRAVTSRDRYSKASAISLPP